MVVKEYYDYQNDFYFVTLLLYTYPANPFHGSDRLSLLFQIRRVSLLSEINYQTALRCTPQPRW